MVYILNNVVLGCSLDINDFIRYTWTNGSSGESRSIKSYVKTKSFRTRRCLLPLDARVTK